MDIEELYEDESFNTLLEKIASKNRICEYDDFRQDVFSDIIQCKYTTNKGFVKSARKIGMRYYRSAFEEDIFNYGINEEGDYSETEEEIMGRLVYHKMAVPL